MKITIDTKQDSKDEIKKIILLLNHLVNSDEIYTNSSSGFSNPFDIPNSGPTENTNNTDTSSNTNVFASMFGDNFSNTSNSTITDSDTVLTQKEETAKTKKLSIFNLEPY